LGRFAVRAAFMLCGALPFVNKADGRPGATELSRHFPEQRTSNFPIGKFA
jgi:hypothetical protein